MALYVLRLVKIIAGLMDYSIRRFSLLMVICLVILRHGFC